MMCGNVGHQPVLLQQAIDLLRVRPGRTYVDATVGLGGHSEAILEQLQGKGSLIGIDRDAAILQQARERLSKKFSNFRLFHENFKNLPLVLSGLGVTAIDGCLADLGVSSVQLDSPERGFSFSRPGPLDMRMDVAQGTTAAQLVNSLPEEKLAAIFREFGEEPMAAAVAREIIRARQLHPLRTSTELADLVSRVKGTRFRRKIHPATQVFQALRIEVNRELEGLDTFLEAVIQRLQPGGRMVVISFHSLEDRIVKRTFRLAAGRCICFRPPQVCTCPRRKQVELLTPRPISASGAEISQNPRARSARLRAVEKLEVSDASKPAQQGEM